MHYRSVIYVTTRCFAQRAIYASPRRGRDRGCGV
jgi:hypothetical protein